MNNTVDKGKKKTWEKGKGTPAEEQHVVEDWKEKSRSPVCSPRKNSRQLWPSVEALKAEKL